MTDQLDWLVQPVPNPLDLEWREEGDEWAEHLRVALTERIPIKTYSTKVLPPSPEFPAESYEVSAESDVLLSRLRLVRLEQGMLVVVVGSDEVQVDEDQVQPWADAIRAATERVGRAHTEFGWSAVIGVAPGPEGRELALGADGQVGPLQLHRAEQHCYETFVQAEPHLFGSAVFGSWPIVVEGTSRGYSWGVASRIAAADLRGLCAVLSVAWDTPMTLREAPAPLEHGIHSIPATTIPGGLPPITPPWHQPVELPEWAEQAWELAGSSPSVRNSLMAFHEGLLLAERHASFAVLAFVASIEGLGSDLYELVRCNTCGSRTGSGKRFRAALSHVLEGEALAIAAEVYDHRSKTAHSGLLHGLEVSFGVSNRGGFLTQDPHWSFSWNDVTRMRDAARALLHRAFEDGWPPLTTTADSNDTR